MLLCPRVKAVNICLETYFNFGAVQKEKEKRTQNNLS
jgi:hypothetical protein